MKIDGPASLRSGAPRRARQNDPAGGDFASHIATDSGAGSASLSGSTQIASVDALIALQGTPASAERPDAAEIDRAEDLLDRLDQIRVGLLTGRLSRATLQGIVDRLEVRRRQGVEPRLAALIDEIELRARVELAKLSMI